MSDIHDLAPARFREEVHSFAFWFQAVEGYLSDRPLGYRPTTRDEPPSGPDRERLVTVLCHYAVGETAALEGASGLVRLAPNRLVKIFLATQVADEGRHLEVFLRRLQALGVADPERAVARRASPKLFAFRDHLLSLVGDGDWDAAIFAQNVILEALEFAVFQRHASTADPVTREILQSVVKDERRHIGFGENELGRRLKRRPDLRDRLAAVRRRLDPLVFAALEDAMATIGVPAAERRGIGAAYLEAVARLGFRP